MTTSSNDSPYKLQVIDQSFNRHIDLSPEDECYFYGTYAIGQSYNFSECNQLIYNFKKPVSVKGQVQYDYKLQAISCVSKLINHFNSAYMQADSSKIAYVPIPPSKARNDPMYDDRLLQALNGVTPTIAVVELIQRTANIQPSHLSSQNSSRPTAQQIGQNLILDPNLTSSIGNSTICLFDDVIVAGSHFKACKGLIRHRFPNSCIIGLFIARAHYRGA